MYVEIFYPMSLTPLHFLSRFLMMRWNIWKSKQNLADILVCNTIYTVIDVCICAYNKKLYDSYTYICTMYNHSKRDYKMLPISTGACLWAKPWNSRPPHQWDAWSVAVPWAATPRPSEQTTEARTVCPTVSLEWKLCSCHVMLYPFLISTF